MSQCLRYLLPTLISNLIDETKIFGMLLVLCIFYYVTSQLHYVWYKLDDVMSQLHYVLCIHFDVTSQLHYILYKLNDVMYQLHYVCLDFMMPCVSYILYCINFMIR